MCYLNSMKSKLKVYLFLVHFKQSWLFDTIEILVFKADLDLTLTPLEQLSQKNMNNYYINISSVQRRLFVIVYLKVAKKNNLAVSFYD